MTPDVILERLVAMWLAGQRMSNVCYNLPQRAQSGSGAVLISKDEVASLRDLQSEWDAARANGSKAIAAVRELLAEPSAEAVSAQLHDAVRKTLARIDQVDQATVDEAVEVGAALVGVAETPIEEFENDALQRVEQLLADATASLTALQVMRVKRATALAGLRSVLAAYDLSDQVHGLGPEVGVAVRDAIAALER